MGNGLCSCHRRDELFRANETPGDLSGARRAQVGMLFVPVCQWIRWFNGDRGHSLAEWPTLISGGSCTAYTGSVVVHTAMHPDLSTCPVSNRCGKEMRLCRRGYPKILAVQCVISTYHLGSAVTMADHNRTLHLLCSSHINSDHKRSISTSCIHISR